MAFGLEEATPTRNGEGERHDAMEERPKAAGVASQQQAEQADTEMEVAAKARELKAGAHCNPSGLPTLPSSAMTEPPAVDDPLFFLPGVPQGIQVCLPGWHARPMHDPVPFPTVDVCSLLGLTEGKRRRLSATVTVDRDAAYEDDSSRFPYSSGNDGSGEFSSPMPLIFFTDGSLFPDDEGKMSAGAVWWDYSFSIWRGRAGLITTLPRKIRTPCLAETTGLAIALEHAYYAALTSTGSKIRCVKIFSDAKEVLEKLQSPSLELQELASAPGMALQRIFDRADDLKSFGVGVHLIWVKAHKWSEGNDIVDRLVKLACCVEKDVTLWNKNSQSREDGHMVDSKTFSRLVNFFHILCFLFWALVNFLGVEGGLKMNWHEDGTDTRNRALRKRWTIKEETGNSTP